MDVNEKLVTPPKTAPIKIIPQYSLRHSLNDPTKKSPPSRWAARLRTRLGNEDSRPLL